MNLARHLDLVADAEAERCRHPFADAVHRQDCGAFERRRIERARRMALMVLGEEQLAFPVEVGRKALQFLDQQAFLEQLFLQQDRNRHRERLEAPRRERDVGFEQALELQERLVVERHLVDGVGRRSCGFEAIADRVVRKIGIVLAARETLFLRRGHDLAVADERRGAVVVEGRYSQDLHPRGLRRSCR